LEIPAYAQEARGTKDAAHWAANLRGHTEGVSLSLRDKNHLDGLAVLELEKVFSGSFLRRSCLENGGRGKGDAFGQLLSQAFGKVGNPFEIQDPSLMDPFGQNPAMEGFASLLQYDRL
jgi:hypothetical protein